MRLFTLQYISLTPPLHFSTELEFVFLLSDIGLTLVYHVKRRLQAVINLLSQCWAPNFDLSVET